MYLLFGVGTCVHNHLYTIMCTHTNTYRHTELTLVLCNLHTSSCLRVTYLV